MEIGERGRERVLEAGVEVFRDTLSPHPTLKLYPPNAHEIRKTKINEKSSRKIEFNFDYGIKVN